MSAKIKHEWLISHLVMSWGQYSRCLVLGSVYPMINTLIFLGKRQVKYTTCHIRWGVWVIAAHWTAFLDDMIKIDNSANPIIQQIMFSQCQRYFLKIDCSIHYYLQIFDENAHCYTKKCPSLLAKPCYRGPCLGRWFP